MTEKTSVVAPLPVAAHRAIQRVLSGTKDDAYSAGRLLLEIPASTAGALLLEVETILMKADPGFWIALEDVREWLCWERVGVTPEPPPSPSDPVPALCVKALFAAGHIRERAVRILAESRNFAALPVLGLRAADWVAQVRGAARAAIIDRLDDDADGTALAAVAPMALHLAARRDGRWLVEQITARLADSCPAHPIERLLTSSNVQLRRVAYRVLSDKGVLRLEHAVAGALHDRDVVIRGRCAEYAARLAVDQGSAAVPRELLASRTPLVRAMALNALNKLGETDAVASALADRSGLVRATARFHLRPHGIDFAGIHRRQLSGDSDGIRPGAVAGLAEVGSAADTDLILPLLSHPRIRVQVEAIRALQAVAPAIDTDRMLTLIEENRSPAVTRQATAAMLARGAGIDPDRLLALLEPTRPLPTRLAAWQLLRSRNSGWRIALNVMLLADPEETVAGRARSDLETVLRQQVYANPSGKAAELLAAHLPNADRFLPLEGARLLRFTLGLPALPENAASTELDPPAVAELDVSAPPRTTAATAQTRERGRPRWRLRSRR